MPPRPISRSRTHEPNRVPIIAVCVPCCAKGNDGATRGRYALQYIAVANQEASRSTDPALIEVWRWLCGALLVALANGWNEIRVEGAIEVVARAKAPVAAGG